MALAAALTLFAGSTQAAQGEGDAGEDEAARVVTRAASSSSATTASARDVGADELAAVPVRGAEDALRLVPGLSVVQHGGEGKGPQVFLRGFDAVHGQDFAVSVEGLPLNEWSNIHAQGYLDLGVIIPEVIQRVRVRKGPFEREQGLFAVAGSADYQLGLDPELATRRVAYTAGTTGRHRLVAVHALGEGGGDGLLAASLLHDAGYGQQRQIERAALNARVVLGRTRSARLSALALGQTARFELPGLLRAEDVRAGRVGWYDAYDQAARGASARAIGALSYEDEDAAGGALRAVSMVEWRALDLLESFTGFGQDPALGDRRQQTQAGWRVGSQVSYARTIARALRLDLGASARAEAHTQRERQRGRALEVGPTRREATITQQALHAHAGGRAQLTTRLMLDAGGRVDALHLSARDALTQWRGGGWRYALSPRVSARYALSPSWHLFGAYGRGVRPPEGRAFTPFAPAQQGIGQEDAAPAQAEIVASDAAELGARWGRGRDLELRAAAFWTRIGREAIFDHVSGLNLALNSTRRMGGELSARAALTRWLTLHADLAYTDARFEASGATVPLAPRLTAGARAIASHPSGWRAGARLLALSPRPLTHGATGSSFTGLDLSAGYTRGRIAVDLAVENALSKQQSEGEYHFASDWRPSYGGGALPVVHQVAGAPLNARLTLTLSF